ncbi:unnamed protein product, partial [Choristocarpus tenellus]
MGEIGGHQLCCFEPVSASAYASVSSDNRLRVWDTASGALRQQYVEPRHLSKQYTSIAWHRPDASVKRDSTGQAKVPDLGLIALGTDKGSVTVWNLRRGAVAHDLGEGQGLQAVTSVAFSLDGSSLFASSSGKDVIEWSLETGIETRRFRGIKQGATKIELHPAGLILAIASSSIKLVDLTTGKRYRKLSAGHAGSVRALAFSHDGRYLASSASSSRFINVFDLSGGGAPEGPVATLSLSSPPLFIDLHASEVGGKSGSQGGEFWLTLLVGMDTGGVEVIRARHTSGEEDPAAVSPVSKCELRGAPPSSSLSVLHGCLNPDSSSTMVLAMGSPVAPEFAEAVFEGANGALLESAVAGFEKGRAGNLDGVEGGGKASARTEKGGEVHVVGPGEMGVSGMERDVLAEE